MWKRGNVREGTQALRFSGNLQITKCCSLREEGGKVHAEGSSECSHCFPFHPKQELISGKFAYTCICTDPIKHQGADTIPGFKAEYQPVLRLELIPTAQGRGGKGALALEQITLKLQRSFKETAYSSTGQVTCSCYSWSVSSK